MSGLYRKVLKGVYPRIPNHFTDNLTKVIKELINVQAELRPSCDQILEMPSVKRLGEKFFGNQYFDGLN